MDQTTKQRLFFALVPSTAVKNNILEFRQNFKIINNDVKIVPESKLHLTLFFLGEVYENCLTEIVENIKNIRFQKFNLKLDYTGYFSNSRVFWLGCNTMPRQLLVLIDNIAYNLQKVPNLQFDFIINKKNKYTPHVTLFKRIALGDITVLNNISPAIDWDIEDFCLIKSKNINNNLEYEIVAKFS
ncbi:MAG: RNA 2',3'-cyclic phosphodiesterase [Gammaproteobacteria bacterium]|nr:RNA 2',3'-cyclic phosphodiesterase [Gammaproteobacteria bacterium]